jgi:hypothetical protein
MGLFLLLFDVLAVAVKEKAENEKNVAKMVDFDIKKVYN